MAASALRSNILLLMSDQHSKYHLGCYGDPLVRTPHLDGLAAAGMRFDDAYCPSPLCVPSRMSFLTARYPSAIRVWNNSHILSSAIPTFAHALGAEGYETALVGRMHFVGSDQRHGFEKRPFGEYFAYHPGVGFLGAPLEGRGMRGTSGQNRGAVEKAGYGRTSYQAFDEMMAEATCGYLREKAQGAGRPFAVVVGSLLPHCPFVAPKELFDYYYERVDVPVQGAEELRREPKAMQKYKAMRGLAEPLPPERIRVARAAYLALCEFYDSLVGQILQTLDETGLAENTLVIYTSDHGEMAGEHGVWWKSSYYEGSVGVPLIARLPGVIAGGVTSDAVCNLVDIGPTLLDMIGGEPMPSVHGRSLWPLLRGDGNALRRDETFSEHLGGRDLAPSRMIRRGPWKLYDYHGDVPPVLYNLDDDPGEMNDLGTDPRYDDIREELLVRLHHDWDPDFVLRESAALDRDLRLLQRWGQAVQLQHEDQVIVPDCGEVTLV